MAEIEFVKKVDDLIPLRLVLVSCTNKTGLVSNGNIEGLPEDGLLGAISRFSPKVLFVSTGGTYKLIKEAGFNVIEVSEFTGYPEMKSGLVKSLHPAIHAGILAHKHTKSDDDFMKAQGLKYFDAVIVNFYALDEMMKNSGATFEMIRQSIDVGGPSMAHNARKAFVSTASITDPSDYKRIIDELRENNGSISLKTRLLLAKKASRMITKYMQSVDNAIQEAKLEDLKECYEIEGRKQYGQK